MTEWTGERAPWRYVRELRSVARSLLDALVFSGFSLPIDRVMTAGEWRVVDGRHVDRERSRAGYAEAVRRLFPAQQEDAV